MGGGLGGMLPQPKEHGAQERQAACTLVRKVASCRELPHTP
jgi:hypothetical protein